MNSCHWKVMQALGASFVGMGMGAGIAVGDSSAKEREITNAYTYSRDPVGHLQNLEGLRNMQNALVAQWQTRETLRLECAALGVPLKGAESVEELRVLRNHYAAGKHLRQTAAEGAALIKELAEQFERINAAARKAKNAAKRERRARKGKR